MLTVGKVEIVPVLDATMDFDWRIFFPNNSPADFDPYRDIYPGAFSPDGKFRTQAHCYALRSQGRTLLIDTGVGPGPIQWLGGVRGRLLEEMSSKGISAEDVQTVAFTHLHSDHVGWNVAADGRPTFPHARYLVPQADWDHFTSPQMIAGSGAQQAVVPLKQAGVMELFSGEIALTEEVTTLSTPGHTPGHTSFLVSSRGERAIITGDLAHHPAQVERTEWCSGFDGEPAGATASRRKVFDQLESEGLTAVLCHFPGDGIGRLVRLEGKRVFQAL